MMLEDSVIGKMLNHMWEMDESGIQKAIEENSLGVSDTKELVRKTSFLHQAFAPTTNSRPVT